MKKNDNLRRTTFNPRPDRLFKDKSLFRQKPLTNHNQPNTQPIPTVIEPLVRRGHPMWESRQDESKSEDLRSFAGSIVDRMTDGHSGRFEFTNRIQKINSTNHSHANDTINNVLYKKYITLHTHTVHSKCKMKKFKIFTKRKC